MQSLYRELYHCFDNEKFNIWNPYKNQMISNVSIEKLSCFSLMKGKKYDENKSLLLVGRAPNGWGCSDALTEQEFVDAAVKNYASNHFDWVQKSDDGKSLISTYYDEDDNQQTYKLAQFFGYAEDIFIKWKGKDYIDSSEKWLDYIAWSNLYKVSPTYAGNPEGRMVNIQREVCRKILLNDIELAKPTHILFFTGYDGWFEFFKEDFPNVKFIGRNCCRGPEKNEIFVEAAGNYSDSKVIVCCRPEFRNKDLFVTDVMRHLQ